MKNKVKNLVLAMILIILALPLAAAYPVTMQLNGNMDFNTAIYQCADSSCSSLGSLYGSDSGNPNTYTINNEGSGTQYFAEFDYVEDRCYTSLAYKTWFDEDTGNGPWQYDIDFIKWDYCGSQIASLGYDSEITDGEIQEITVEAKSPFLLNPDGPQAVPEELEYYYSTNVEVYLTIEKEGIIVYEETLNSDILWGKDKQFVFTFEPASSGTYDIIAKTRVDDCMCTSYTEQEQTGSFVVSYTLPGPEDTTPPGIEIISPEAITYDNQETLVEINAYDENLEEVWFSYGTGNIIYIGPIYITFPEGTNTLTAWAEDTAGNTNSDSVTFNIQLGNDDEDDEDEDGGCYSKKVDLEITDIYKKNVKCGDLAKITFKIKNLGDRREDVLLKIENSELGINELRIITLDSKEEELLTFYLKIPLAVKDKLYYLSLTAESRGRIIEEKYPIEVECGAEKTIIVSQEGGEITLKVTDTESSQGTGGITGSTVGIGDGILNPAAIISLLIILNIIIIAAIILINRG